MKWLQGVFIIIGFGFLAVYFVCKERFGLTYDTVRCVIRVIAVLTIINSAVRVYREKRKKEK